MIGSKNIKIVILIIALMAVLAVSASSAQVVSQGTIANTVGNYADLTTLIKAINAAGIGDVLNGKGPYTLFAPTNTAFDKFTPNTLSLLFQDKQKVGDVMMYHIVPGKLTVSDLAGVSSLKTIDGRTLPVTVTDGYIDVGGSRVINKGVECTNGIIYPVDNVILPPASAAPLGAPVLMPQQAQQPAYNPPAATPVAQPPAPKGVGGIMILGFLILAAIVLGALFVVWLLWKFLKGIFRGPQPRYQPPGKPGYTQPARSGTQDVREPAQFGTGGTTTMRDEGPYVSTGAPAGAPVTGAITFDESAVNELQRMDKSRLAGLRQYIIGSYNNFRDRLDLARDAHIDLQDIRDSNAVSRFMDKYRLSQFNSNTLELALEKNATIYTMDQMLMDIYRAAGARVEDLRKLVGTA